MPVTTQLNEKANVKLGTAADTLIAGRKIVSLEELQTSTALQTTIIISTFAVDVAVSKSLLVFYDGRLLTEGASNDYTLTSISAQNTSNTISLNQALAAGRNIKLLYLGVVVTNSESLDTLSPAISDWINSGPTTITSTGTFPTKGTVVTDEMWWRRVGDSMEIRMSFKQSSIGTAGTGDYLFKIPNGYMIDLNKVKPTISTGVNVIVASDNAVGYFDIGDFTNNEHTSGLPVVYDAFNVRLIGDTATTGGSFPDVIGATHIPLNHAANMSYNLFLTVPIAGWSSNVIAAQSKVFQASAYAANGVNVTATPANLGEYRTYKKTAAALSGTDDPATGSYIPTVANGFKIDGSTNFASAGSPGQPNRIEIFIGRNKHPTYDVYASTGRTGAVSRNNDPSSGTSYYGLNFDYDPITGVVTVDAIDQPSGTTTRNVARSIPSGGAAPADLGVVYFEINVSDNVLPVQFSDPSKVAKNVARFSSIVGASVGSGPNVIASVFTNIPFVYGTAITPVHDSVNGDYFLINEPGLYDIFMTVRPSIFADWYIWKNINDSVTAPAPDTDERFLIYTENASGTRPEVLSNTAWLVPGDRIYSINPDAATNNGTSVFEIKKIANG